MTSEVSPVEAARRRWRRLCLIVAVLGLVVVAASALPWFLEIRTLSGGGTRSEAVNLWTEGPSVSARGRAAGLAKLAASGQWGLFVVIVGALGALMGLFARGKHPGDPGIGPALRLNVGAAALAPVFTLLALISANSGERIVAVPHVGFILTVPAVVGWVVCSVLMMRMAKAARLAGRAAW